MEDHPAAIPHLLIVTVDRELARHVREMLAGFPCPSVTMSSPAEAAHSLMSADPPGVALLDSALPGQSGLDLASTVKRACGRNSTWMILLLRGDADPSAVISAADADVDDVLLCAADGQVSKTELRVRLGVGTRIHAMTRQLEAQAQAISFHSLRDSLTGVWNREPLLSLLFPETDRVQRLGSPMTLMLVDVDEFSRVNAEFGYEAGDRILKELASRLRRAMRSYDLLGRTGEDEFLAALPGCAPRQARHLAHRIRTALLRRPFLTSRDEVSLTVSIGLAASHGRSPLVVLREAECALATAKQEGRNCEREYAFALSGLSEQAAAGQTAQPPAKD